MSNIFLPTQTENSNALVEQKKQEATSLIQSAMLIAKKFPRDQSQSFASIMENCKRVTLAQQAMYSYPRGGQVVTGPSIRLAEVIANGWGNIRYGFNEIEQGNGYSVVEAFCHDLQSNTLVVRTFSVSHSIDTKNGSKKLGASRDIYEHVANYAQRRVRAAILEVIPYDVIEAAVQEVKKTLAKGNGEPIIDRIRKLIIAFKDLGVTQEMLEKRLGHKIDITTAEEIVDLTGIFMSIKDKQAKRSDFFDFIDDEEVQVSDKVSEFKKKLQEQQNDGPKV